MRTRRAKRTLPVDVRVADGAQVTEDLLVEAVLDALPSPTVLLAPDGTVLLTNSVWRDAATFLGDDRFRIGVGDDYFALARLVRDDAATDAMIEAVKALSRGETDQVAADYALPHADGTRWYHLQVSRVDQAGHVVVTHTDITGRVEAEQAALFRAHHDPLTELPNRARLHELIDAELRRPGRSAVTVLFLDVDGFKEVNDSLGHEVGDDLLRQLSERLTGRTRAESEQLLSSAQRQRDDLLGTARRQRDDLLARAQEEAERLLADAETEAERLIEEGRTHREALIAQALAEHERLITETEVYRGAVSRADELGAQTATDVARMRAEVDQYVDSRLADFGTTLERMLHSVETARTNLREP